MGDEDIFTANKITGTGPKVFFVCEVGADFIIGL